MQEIAAISGSHSLILSFSHPRMDQKLLKQLGLSGPTSSSFRQASSIMQQCKLRDCPEQSLLETKNSWEMVQVFLKSSTSFQALFNLLEKISFHHDPTESIIVDKLLNNLCVMLLLRLGEGQLGYEQRRDRKKRTF